MSLFALVRLRRGRVFAFSLFLLSVAGVKDDASRVLVAEPDGHTWSARPELPLSFEPNLGQADPRVKFLSRGSGYTLFLTEDEAVVALRKSGARRQDSGFRIQDSGGRRQKSEEERRPWSVVRGQLHETREGGRSASLVTPHSSLQFPAPSPQPPVPSILRLKLLRANPAAKVTGLDELPGKSNYFIGNDPKKWRTHVPTYGRVRYENVYPGVDLVYYGNKGGQLEYDFVVAPGADLGPIALAIDVEGQVSSSQKAVGRGGSSMESTVDSSQLTVKSKVAKKESRELFPQGRISVQLQSPTQSRQRTTDPGPRTSANPKSQIQNRKSKISPSLRIVANGDLIVTTTDGDVRFHKPVVYQMQSTVDSSQLTVESRGAMGRASSDHGPRAAANPKSKIRNPKLIDGRYILTSDGEVTFEIAPYDRTRPLIIDPVLSYSTYLGGSDMDYANGIAVDPSGNAYVTGYTASIDFPLVTPAQSSPGGGTCTDGVATIACFDAFVTKLNPAGTGLVYSTYLGGSGQDYGTRIALDASGDAYVTGYTNSTDFPVQNALQSENAGGFDVFVAELSADGASLIYSTYWGGSGDDIGTGVAIDSSGNAYISGYTASPDFPVTPGDLQATFAGGDHNGFVVKFNSGGAVRA